jgi:hydroxymethylpyrimidine/phosphomethylpyrimidine kinase
MRTALTIAGSDSIAGAGIQADLKTFAAFGIYGVSALTAVTAQNTTGVADIFALSPEGVRAQIDQIAQDVEIGAVKTGMLATAEIVRVVVEAVERIQSRYLVVDPVMASGRLRPPSTVARDALRFGEGQGFGEPGRSTGRTLLTPEAVLVLKTLLLPKATVVTPNVAEAAALCGIHVDSLSTAREAARHIAGLGASAVIIKGGHLSGPLAIDVLFHAGVFTELAAPRAAFDDVHGTGCTFASAIAAGLALGDDIPAAAHRAKRYITGAIEQSFEIGHGARVLNHFWDPPSPRTL